MTATARASQPSVLDEFKPYLHERFNAGVINSSVLFREIREQGYRGSRGTLADYLAPFRPARWVLRQRPNRPRPKVGT